MANQVHEGTSFARIYSEFPYWLKHQVCMLLLLKQIVVIEIHVTIYCCMSVSL